MKRHLRKGFLLLREMDKTKLLSGLHWALSLAEIAPAEPPMAPSAC